MKDDEHAGNKVGMLSVFGSKFIEERTSACEYQVHVKKHKMLVIKHDRKSYKRLCHEMKDAITENVYDL